MIVDFYSNRNNSKSYACVGIKIDYRLATNSDTTNILSYTVLDDDIRYEELSSKLEEAEVQGLIM
ncbi:SX2_G0008220.mRNA.1.CDS.1 [Saccharomyces cerevisiae]|nr:SX2_G0008220.mRNA.1.CDS.1 [Saccharomyces cerevisiae]